MNVKFRLRQIKQKIAPPKTEQPSQYFIDQFNQAQADVDAGRVSPTFKSAKDAIAWLREN